MEKMEKLAAELRAEADFDFLDLPFIAASVGRELDLHGHDELRHHTLGMVRNLMHKGVFAGDYNLDDLESGRGFQFRRGSADEIISWIEAEWISMGHAPTQEEPICWFSLRRWDDITSTDTAAFAAWEEPRGNRLWAKGGLRDPDRTVKFVNKDDIAQARKYNDRYEGGLLWVVNDERLIAKYGRMLEEDGIHGVRIICIPSLQE